MSRGRRHHHHHLKASNAAELMRVLDKLRARYPGRSLKMHAVDGYLLVCVASSAVFQANPEGGNLGRGVASRWIRIRIWTPSE